VIPLAGESQGLRSARERNMGGHVSIFGKSRIRSLE
jgi:hypothetical protein